MKKLLVSILAVAALVACGKEEAGKAGVDNITDPNPTAIELGVGVKAGIEAKAPVNDNPGFSGTDKIGVYGLIRTGMAAGDVTYAAGTPAAWIAAPYIKNNQAGLGTLGAVDAAKQAVAFSAGSNYVYPQYNAANSIYNGIDIYSYYPYAAEGTTGANYVTAPAAGTAPVLNFTITGQEDVMWAPPVLGYKGILTKPNLAFAHKLTQLNFAIVGKEDFPDTEYIKSITFKGVNSTNTMNVATGVLGTWANPINTIAVQGISATPIPATLIPIDISANQNIASQRAAQKLLAGSAVMLQPGLTEFTADITTTTFSYSNVKIYPDGTQGTTVFNAGTAYTITLVFNANQVMLTATVSPWLTGTGYADVE